MAGDETTDPGVSQPTGAAEAPVADIEEAAAAADSPPEDQRRPPDLSGTAADPLTLEQLRDRVAARFQITSDIAHGELTIHVEPGQLLDVLTFCKEDEQLELGFLADLSGVHWPAGDHVIERQPSTTGWPDYRVTRERGVIEVLYILRSWRRNHWLRVSVGVDDENPVLPSATGIHPTANFHEREVYDFFGVTFEGHPGLTRILMPDDWVGHPHRKDYPLGGVNIDYEHDKFIPPPQDRDLREIVGGES